MKLAELTESKRQLRLSPFQHTITNARHTVDRIVNVKNVNMYLYT